jgi:hypothetical protein
MDHIINQFKSGVHNLLDDESIPKDAASDSKNFLTQDGRIKLVGGRVLIGQDGVAGKITGHHFAYKRDGTKIHYRKAGTKIQYLNGTTWTDVITGLTSDAEYTFANYSSLSGDFVLISGADGLYKINTVFPASYVSLYDKARNDKGKIIVDKGRLIMWDLANASKTTLKMSHIDGQDSDVYTTATAEVLGASGNTTYTGTLAFKGNNSAGKTFTVDASTDIFTSAAHGFVSGDVVKVSSDTTLPAGLDNSTLYYVQKLSADTFYLFSDADYEVRVDLTDTGTGTHTAYLNGARRNCFGLMVTGTVAAGLEQFVDNRDGTLTSNKGGTGTINYTTGAYSVTFSGAVASGNVLAEYQWEDSTKKGLADFTFSATRVASEGNRITQDIGGDPIVTVLVGQDGAYYSLKEQSSYRLEISADDTQFTNLVYRRDMGVPHFRAGASTSKGVVFMNTAIPENPELTILQRNPLGDNIEPVSLFKHFDFTNYSYDDACIDTADTYIVIACRTTDSVNNNVILMCDFTASTVDPIYYPARTFAKNSGNLYIGSPITENIYEILNGFDDDSYAIENHWISKAETYDSERLKKFRRLRFKGLIDPDQTAEVSVSYDGADYELVGTIRGDGSYVDYTNPQSIGSNMIGEAQVGGDDVTTAYPYFMEIKVSTPKFRKRKIKIQAKNYGYFDTEMITDFDILTFEQRIPTRFRQKQNVSLDGTETNQ